MLLGAGVKRGFGFVGGSFSSEALCAGCHGVPWPKADPIPRLSLWPLHFLYGHGATALGAVGSRRGYRQGAIGGHKWELCGFRVKGIKEG